MALVMVGLSHKSAPLELREALALDHERKSRAYQELKQGDLEELVLLSTCNRVEAYAFCEDAKESEGQLRKWFENLDASRSYQTRKSLSSLEDDEALWHLLQVAGSLDSMVVGESQILGQVKEAYEDAVQGKAIGPYFHGLFQRIFSAAKEVRTDTELGKHPASVPSVAVQLAGRLFGSLEGRRAALVGAGKMAELVAEHLKGAGIGHLDVLNRSLSKAKDLAKRFGGEALSLGQLSTALAKSDVAVFSAASKEALLTSAEAKKLFESRSGAPMLMIDIAVPRNVEASVKDIESAYLYNVDDLGKLAEEHKERRLEASREAKSILRRRYYEIREWMASSKVNPVIKGLAEHFEGLRKTEWEKQASKLKHLDSKDLAQVEYLTQALVKKILDQPIRNLKASLKEGHAAIHVKSLETLFSLKDED
jgi:glutamyl-tRNA reductase